MKNLIACFGLLLFAACSSTNVKDGAKSTAKNYCEQQCQRSTLNPSEQFDCKRRCQ